MAAEKLVTIFGLLGDAPEPSGYGSGVPSTLDPATDGIWLTEPVVAELDYIHAGERGQQPGAGGELESNVKSGRSATLSPIIEGRGLGSVYTSTADEVPDIHDLMLISGHSATHDASVGTESWTFAPESSGFDSGFFEAYSRGQRYDLNGAYASLSLSGEAGAHAMFEFAISALSDALPADEALPVITYTAPAVKPPKIINVTLDLNAVNTGWVLRSFSFEQNRTLDPRADGNSTGHAGFSPGRRAPTMEIVVEARPLATIDPFTLMDLSTAVNLSFTVGSVQYNRFTFTAPQFQITSVEDGEDGATAIWTITGKCAESGPTTNDAYSLLFD